MGVGKRAIGTGLAVALTASLVGGAVVVAQEGDGVTILSTQFEPIEEREKMNNIILADVPVETEYLTVPNTTIFFEQVDADPSVDAVGALHGEFAALAKDDKLVDLSDLAAELGVSESLLEVGKLGDMVVLGGDPLTCEEDHIKDIAVELTFLGGREMFGPDIDDIGPVDGIPLD